MSAPATAMSCDVVIPARNAEAFIGAAIQSVLDQTLPASRIIVVNDRSTDGTAAVAATFGNRVRIIDGNGLTAGSARNLAMLHSDSSLVAFLDADDVCYAERLRTQVKVLSDAPAAVMVFCDAEYTDGAGRPTGSVFTCPEFSGEAFLGQLFERNRVLSASVAMVRRAAFDAVGGFDERLSHAEDYDLWLRLARIGRIAHVDRSLVGYRLHAHNLSGDQEALRQAERQILRKHAVADVRAALLRSYGHAARADVALSRVLFRMELFAEAETMLRHVDPEDVDRALFHFMLGNLAVTRGEVETATSEYERCLACDATFAPCHNNLGVIAARAGRRPQAVEHFVTAAELRPGYTDPRANSDAIEEGNDSRLRYTFAPLRAVLRPDLKRA